MTESDTTTVKEAPTHIGGIIRHMGPGAVTAAAIVGSGELVATTKTGAQAGMALLWLIIIGCVIKVFTQIEIGRYAISSGKGTLRALNEVPGPKVRVRWTVWFWLIMFVFGLFQLGGVVHGAGQTLALSFPITGDYLELLDSQEAWDVANAGAVSDATARPDGTTNDDVLWSGIITLITVAMLAWGRYALVEVATICMVAFFTLMTLFCVIALQFKPEWMLSLHDILGGLQFRLPPVSEQLAQSPMITALATFGIIGVGANELIAYPYWCLEKGYGKYAGPKEETDAWYRRAAGWMRVMRWDAFVSMGVYTLSTIAFYILGATVLYRQGLDPSGESMIKTLGEMYLPVFGPEAEIFFFLGAFVVLFSTFFAASASHARVASDAVNVFGFSVARETMVRAFSIGFPIFAFIVIIVWRNPVQLIILGGLMQALMLPVLGVSTLYFRYRRTDTELKPGTAWDICLWLSVIGLTVAGGWILVNKLSSVFGG